MNKILEFIKKIVISMVVLYGYNLVATRFNLVIPINIITVLAISLLGFPMLFVLVLLKVLFF